MPALINRAFQWLSHPKTEISKEKAATETRHFMMCRPICPCCSSTLLRHIRSGAIYWRCSYCQQEMPVL